MKTERNVIFKGAKGRYSVADFYFANHLNAHTIIFVHGYKGFKDWGAWDLVAKYFQTNGFNFVAFNMSHNGGTVENPIDFPDLDAFAENRYSYELKDLKQIIDLTIFKFDVEGKNISLIGHSRGGAIAMLSALNDAVANVVTWAAIDSIEDRFPKGEMLSEWKKTGVRFVKNSRTNQMMPHKFNMYLDWVENKDLLNIQSSVSQESSKVNFLHVHGDKDEAVDFSAASQISAWSGGDVFIVEGAGHTFGGFHPYTEKVMPEHLEMVCATTIEFINKALNSF